MYGNNYFNQGQRFQPMTMMGQQMVPQSYVTPVQQATSLLGLSGKVVDSMDVVKAMDIPLDGSVSYFPLSDGSSIITKKLQSDGTSKTSIYKLVEEENVGEGKFVTLQAFNSLREELNELREKLQSKEA